MAKEKNNSGAKTKLTAEVLQKVERLAGKGFFKAQIADTIGIAPTTFSEWMKRKEFSEAFHRGQKKYQEDREKRIQQAIDGVEDAAMKRAQGYTTKETKSIYRVLKNGTEKLVRKEIRDVHIPADPNAFKFILLNKRPKDYQEHVDVSARFDGQLAIRVVKASEAKKDENKSGSK